MCGYQTALKRIDNCKVSENKIPSEPEYKYLIKIFLKIYNTLK